jgi:hypothetical protein
VRQDKRGVMKRHEILAEQAHQLCDPSCVMREKEGRERESGDRAGAREKRRGRGEREERERKTRERMCALAQ